MKMPLTKILENKEMIGGLFSQNKLWTGNLTLMLKNKNR